MYFREFLPAVFDKKFKVALQKLEWQKTDSLEYKKYGLRHDRISNVLLDVYKKSEINAMDILEIGGRLNPHKGLFSDEVKYSNLDLSKTDENVLVGDITACPQIPDNSFDVVLSVDVFEHINKPWLAASEITRILRPGGLSFHSTLFAWRYHPCPQDFFRYTPDGLKSLFCDLDCVLGEFDGTERRRNIVGNGKNKMVPDAFGGWRENWRVHYAGIKRK